MNNQMLRPRFWFLTCFLVYATSFRLIPYALNAAFGTPIHPDDTTYPWNFSPLYALCLFAGARFQDRRWAFGVPLAVMLIGDLGIGLLSRRLDWMLYPDQAFVYVAMALMIASGLLLRRTRSWAAIAGAGLGSSVMFFVLTNFGVWLVGDNARYTHDLAGLVQCYTLALPFFRNTLISMALFSALLFSPVAVTAPKPTWQPVPSLE